MNQRSLELSRGCWNVRDLDDENFETILEDTSLRGWKMCGPGAFAPEDGTIVSRGGMGLLWYAEKKFRDFILRAEWKANRSEDNSGIFVRFADPHEDPSIAVSTGYEIQICDEPKDGNTMHRTGAVYDFSSPSMAASKAPGEWNAFEIHAIGQSYAVILNDEKVTEFTGSRQLEGYVGLQNHDAGSRVSFGKIAVREL